MLHISYT